MERMGLAIKNVIKFMIDKIIKFLPNTLKSRLMIIPLKDFFFSRNSALKNIMCTEWCFRVLKENGFLPAAIIDCGAYVGNWTREIKNIFPASRVLMIEANPVKEASLKKVQNEYPETVDYTISLLGPENRKDVKFYSMETGSSVLEEQRDTLRNILLLPMETLDNVAREKGFSDASFIKLDVQGYELEVLKGAKRLLEKAELILLEVSFLQYNKGAPLIDEVTAFMKSHGFVVYDIGSLLRWGATNTLLQGDVIFIKQDSELRQVFFNFKLSGFGKR